MDKQVDGMDAFAVKQACKFAKQHALEKGPIVSLYFSIIIRFVFFPFGPYSSGAFCKFAMSNI